MAQLRTLEVLTTASGDQAASLPTHFVRQQEFSGTLSGKANAVHRHNASDIDNLIPLLVALLGENAVASQSILWEISGTEFSGSVRLKPNGGVLVDAEGLFIDSGTVSVPGHHHVAADINDLQTALYQQLQQLFSVSSTIEWSFEGNEISGTVRLRPAAGILDSGDGLALDFGSGTNQAARGDHSHAQLHNAVTLGVSNSLSLALAGQQLNGEVRLAPLSALVADGTGLRVDLGSGTNQAARGDHAHALLHNPVTVLSDAALTLSISGQQALSGTVRLDPAPPIGFGRLVVGVNGVAVALGTGDDEAAAGDHGHSIASEAASGFLSPTDKTHLDVLWAAGTPSGTLPPSGTMDSLQTRVLYLVNVNTGQSRALTLDDSGVLETLSGTVSVTRYESPAMRISGAAFPTRTVLAHGFGQPPTEVYPVFKCEVADSNWGLVSGTEMPVSSILFDNGGVFVHPFTWYADASNIYLVALGSQIHSGMEGNFLGITGLGITTSGYDAPSSLAHFSVKVYARK